jgi:flagellar L-ring protein precursor FlgH
MRRSWIAVLVMTLLLVAPMGALSKKPSSLAQGTKATPPEDALRNYIMRVRARQAEVRTAGSLWSADGQMVRLGTDVKAFRIHDVVSVVVTESLAASTDGQVKNSRASSANSGLTSLFGALKASNALQYLVGASASSGLTAQGQSTTNSSLATTFGAEVGGCTTQRHTGGAGHAAVDIQRTDATDRVARPGTPRGCEQPEPGAVDRHDRPGAGGYG